MAYKVYTAEYIGLAINHKAIFVLTQEDHAESGRLFHVTGNISARGKGMKYEGKRAKKPTSSITYVPGTEKFIGSVSKARMADFETTCQSIPVPGPQIKTDGALLDPSKPVRRCIEWIDEAVAALVAEGVVE